MFPHEFFKVLNGLKNCKDGHKFQLHVKDNKPTFVSCKGCTEKWYIN